MSDVAYGADKPLDQGPQTPRLEQWLDDESKLSIEFNRIGAGWRLAGLIGISIAMGILSAVLAAGAFSRFVGTISYHKSHASLEPGVIGNAVGQVIPTAAILVFIAVSLRNYGKSVGSNIALLRGKVDWLLRREAPREGMSAGWKRSSVLIDAFREEREHIRSDVHLRVLAPARAYGDIVLLRWPNMRGTLMRALGGPQDAGRWAKALRGARAQAAPDGWPVPAEAPQGAVRFDMSRKQADRVLKAFYRSSGVATSNGRMMMISYLMNVILFVVALCAAILAKHTGLRLAWGVASAGVFVALVSDAVTFWPSLRARLGSLANMNGAIEGVHAGPALFWPSSKGLRIERRFFRCHVDWAGLDHVQEQDGLLLLVSGNDIEMIAPADTAIIWAMQDAGLSPVGGPWADNMKGRTWKLYH